MRLEMNYKGEKKGKHGGWTNTTTQAMVSEIIKEETEKRLQTNENLFKIWAIK